MGQIGCAFVFLTEPFPPESVESSEIEPFLFFMAVRAQYLTLWAVRALSPPLIRRMPFQARDGRRPPGILPAMRVHCTPEAQRPGNSPGRCGQCAARTPSVPSARAALPMRVRWATRTPNARPRPTDRWPAPDPLTRRTPRQTITRCPR